MIFKRSDPVAEFWTWWARVRWRAAESLLDPAVVAGLNRHVSAIDKRLRWEFAPGRAARHLLVVSSGGDAKLRSLTERWRRAGPADDDVFEYATTRPGNPAALHGPLIVGGFQVDLSAIRFTASMDDARGLVHVRVWHPSFAEWSASVRTQVKYLALDRLLGEDVVEIWLAGIEAITSPGSTPLLTGAELAVLVTARIPADGQYLWRSFTGTRDGHPLIAAAQTPLRPATHPGYEVHIRIVVPYAGRRASGLPTKPALAELYALEDHIYQRADGAVLIAHEMCDGVWTTHLYAARPAAAEALKPVVSAWPHGRVEVTATTDPTWLALAHLADATPLGPG